VESILLSILILFQSYRIYRLEKENKTTKEDIKWLILTIEYDDLYVENEYGRDKGTTNPFVKEMKNKYFNFLGEK
jgi:hypothetical protein